MRDATDEAMITVLHHPNAFPAALLAMALVAGLADGRQIDWFSDAHSVHRQSSGLALDESFRFELGVFAGSFVPTVANIDQWAAHWVAAQRVAYVPAVAPFEGTGSFAGFYQVTTNPAPFSAGKKAYIWGFNRDYQDAQWILLSDSAWTWPLADPFNPLALEWNVAAASGPGEVILGSVNPTGAPFLIETAVVAVASPPPTSWHQWRSDSFDAEALADPLTSGPTADPDGDGLSNLEEYAYATPPMAAAPRASVTGSVLTIEPDQFLALTVPLRPDRAVAVEVGVSDDLVLWDFAAANTVLVSESPAGVTFRSADPLASQPRQFLRARLTLTE